MANALDLQEQEQLDQLKAFWKQYGNLITWLITAVLLAYAGWNGWQWYQRDQAVKAAAIFEELDKAAAAGEVTTPMARGWTGTGRLRAGSNRPSASSRALSRRNCSNQAPCPARCMDSTTSCRSPRAS